ncbi:MAG: ComEC/Rec2 family competence protein [Chloroflexota bacterium]
MTLARLAAVFVLGVLGGTYVGVPVTYSATAAILLVLCALVLRRRPSGLHALLLGGACLGLMRSPQVQSASSSTIAFYAGHKVQVVGVVGGEPDVRARHVAYQIAVENVQIGAFSHLASGALTVYTPASVDLAPGEKVMFTGYLGRRSRTRLFLPPLQTPFMLYPRIADQGPTSKGLETRVSELRAALTDGIERWLPEPEAALLLAITLGSHSASLGALAAILVSTGLIHLVAISGIKVALVAGTINSLLRPLGRRLLSLVATLPVLWTYVALTGFTPSGERSALMWTMIFMAGALGRGTVSLVSLSVVVALMVGVTPELLGDLGFLLSVTGTAAIVAFTFPLTRLFRWVPSPWRDVLAVTIAAQIGTLPLVIYGFHVLSLSGPLANMLVLPLVPLLIVLGFLVGGLATVSWLVAPLAALAHALLYLTIAFSTALAAWVPSWRLAGFAASLSTLYFIALTVIAARVLRRAQWAPAGGAPHQGREFAFGLVTAASALSISLLSMQHGATFRVDVDKSGHVVLQSGRHLILVDGGSDPFALRSMVGGLLPLDQRSVDAVVVTDPSAANVQGLLGLLPRYSIGAVLDVGSEYPDRTYAHWRALLRHAHTPVYALRTGARLTDGPFNLTAVGPDALRSNARDGISLLRVRFAGHMILLAGRASVREQHEAVFRGVPLRADTLVLGGPVDSAFLHAVHPQLLVDSLLGPNPPGRAGVRIVSDLHLSQSPGNNAKTNTKT